MAGPCNCGPCGPSGPCPPPPPCNCNADQSTLVGVGSAIDPFRISPNLLPANNDGGGSAIITNPGYGVAGSGTANDPLHLAASELMVDTSPQYDINFLTQSDGTPDGARITAADAFRVITALSHNLNQVSIIAKDAEGNYSPIYQPSLTGATFTEYGKFKLLKERSGGNLALVDLSYDQPTLGTIKVLTDSGIFAKLPQTEVVLPEVIYDSDTTTVDIKTGDTVCGDAAAPYILSGLGSHDLSSVLSGITYNKYIATLQALVHIGAAYCTIPLAALAGNPEITFGIKHVVTTTINGNTSVQNLFSRGNYRVTLKPLAIAPAAGYTHYIPPVTIPMPTWHINPGTTWQIKVQSFWDDGNLAGTATQITVRKECNIVSAILRGSH